MYEYESAFNSIRVVEQNGVRLLRFQRNQQSSMRLDDPFETDIEYFGYLHLTLAVKPQAKRALVIGLGGGTVVKRMWRDYPDMHIDVVEIDPEVIEVARYFFALPEDGRIKIFIDDGRDYIERCCESYDIIIVDAFDDFRMPRPLMTEEFLRQCRDRLTTGGVIAYNCIGTVTGSLSKPFRSFYRTASNIWRKLWVFNVRTSSGAKPGSSGNIIMLAADTEMSTDTLLKRISERVDGRVSVPGFESFGKDLYRSKIRTGDAGILVDDPSGKQRRWPWS